MIAPQPVAYIRRSVARRGDPGDVSREFQTEKVRALASGDGSLLQVIDADWGKSGGRHSTHLRIGFLDLLQRIERGEVSTVYAYSADRLARDVEASARLLNAAERTGTVINAGGLVADPGNRDAYGFARQMFHQQAVMNEGVLDEMKRKAAAAAETVRARGTATGGRAYGEVRQLRNGETRGQGEDPEVVVAAWREAGSYYGAARLLNERGVPARSGGLWYARGVQRIVNRAEPATRRTGRRGAPSRTGEHRLDSLLRCHCGAVMGRTFSGEGTPRYRCPVGATDKAHSRPYIVPERQLLPWVMAEAARFAPQGILNCGQDSAQRRAAIAEERRRLALAFARGGLDDDTYAAEDARLEAESEGIDAAGSLVGIPALSWDWDPARINSVLRTYWRSVQLGTDLRPVSADWRIPAEYLADR